MRTPAHIHVLLIYVTYGSVWPYIEFALSMNDWEMLLTILGSMCNPLAIGYRD